TSTEWRIPQGYEQVLETADQFGTKKQFMIFYDQRNLPEFLQDSAAQIAFIDALKKVLEQQLPSLDGISIDFEGLIQKEHRSSYVQFLERVKEAIGELKLSVAVPPPAFQYGYDLKRIGEIADEVILMAYDYT